MIDLPAGYHDAVMDVFDLQSGAIISALRLGCVHECQDALYLVHPMWDALGIDSSTTFQYLQKIAIEAIAEKKRCFTNLRNRQLRAKTEAEIADLQTFIQVILEKRYWSHP